jgi:ABC-2 type transport system ATP-binding protein
MHQGRLIQCDTPQKLKEGIPGLLLELETAQPRVAREALASRLGSNRVSLFGGKLHLYAADEAEAEQARTALREANISVLGENVITPSLEDVFIHQVTRSNEETAA